MVLDALAWLSDAVTPDAPSPDSSHDILVAVIGVAGPLLLGVMTLFITARRRADPPAAAPSPAPVPLNSDPDDEDDDDVELRAARARIRAYERFLFRHRIDPNGVHTGDEAMADVRIE